MEDHFSDNEIDKAFRSSLEHLDSTPSDKFWEEAEKNMAIRNGNLGLKRAIFWKSTSLALLLLLGISAFYIGHLHNKLNSKKPLIESVGSTKPSPSNERATAHAHSTPTIEAIPSSATSSLASTSPEKNSDSQAKVITKEPKSIEASPLFVSKNPAGHLRNPQKAISDVGNSHQKGTGDLNPENVGIIAPTPTANSQIPTATLFPNEMKNSTTVQNDLKNNTTALDGNTSITPVATNLIPAFLNQDKTMNQLDTFANGNSISNNLTVEPPSAFLIRAFFSPTAQLENTKANSHSSSSSGLIYLKEENDKSYSFGLRIGMDMGSRWSIQTGVDFFHTSCTFGSKVIQNQNPQGDNHYSLVSNTGTVELSSENDSLQINSNSMQQLSYLKTPFLMSYDFGKGRFGLSMKAGLTGNFLLSTKSLISITNEDHEEQLMDGEISGLRRFTPGFTTGLGFTFLLSKHVMISLEPFYSQTFLPINKGTPLLTHSQVFGCESGIIYHF